jgi:hypothetical protein
MTQPNPASIRPPVAFLRIALASTAAAAALGLVGYWPTVVQGGVGSVKAMVAGIAISLVGGWIGTIPTIAFLSRPPREHPMGILAGLGARFAVTLGLAIAAVVTGAFSNVPLLLWVGISQLVILGVDVFSLVGLLRQAARDAR